MGGELAVAVGNGIIDGKWIEPPLQSTDSCESEASDRCRSCDEHTEVKLRHADNTDGQLSRQGTDVFRNQNAGIQ